MADWEKQQSIYQQIHYFFTYVILSIVLLCRALAALGFGNLCRLALKSGRFSSTKARDLCCFARKAIVRRHESTTVILVLRGDFACQHNWRLRWGRKSLSRRNTRPILSLIHSAIYRDATSSFVEGQHPSLVQLIFNTLIFKLVKATERNKQSVLP